MHCVRGCESTVCVGVFVVYCGHVCVLRCVRGYALCCPRLRVVRLCPSCACGDVPYTCSTLVSRTPASASCVSFYVHLSECPSVRRTLVVSGCVSGPWTTCVGGRTSGSVIPFNIRGPCVHSVASGQCAPAVDVTGEAPSVRRTSLGSRLVTVRRLFLSTPVRHL